MMRLFFTSITLLFTFPALAQFQIDVESGLVSPSYNDVRIPGTSGTKFSFIDNFESKPELFLRGRLTYTLNQKHTFSVLYAPLSLEKSGQFDQDVNFENTAFKANQPITGTYQFNSYRLTYRYNFQTKGKVQFGLGLTAKIRDAKVQLQSEQNVATNTNVGFVPLINFKVNWQMTDNLGLMLLGDALGAKQGRAEDVLLALHYQIAPSLALKTGYRVLEGGVDNDEVYNFTWLNYFVVGGIITF